METITGLNSSVGACLREARKAVNLTQEELAFRAGLDRTYISLLERGMKNPTLTVFLHLCQVLDQKPDVLMAHIVDRQEQTAQAPLY